jgi:hypothetical protein
MYAFIIGISTNLVPKTTFLPLSSIIFSTIALEVKSSLSWMVSLAIIKSTLFLMINIRLLLFVLGVLFPIGNSLSVSRTLAQLFNALCLMLFMISSTFFNNIWTIYLLTQCIESITQPISEPFSSAVGSTVYV